MTIALEMVFTPVKTTCPFELFAHQIWSPHPLSGLPLTLSHISSYLASVCFAMPHCHLFIPGLDFPWRVSHCSTASGPTQQPSRCADCASSACSLFSWNPLPSSAGTSLSCTKLQAVHPSYQGTPLAITRSPCVARESCVNSPLIPFWTHASCHTSTSVPLCTRSSWGRLTTNSFILLTSMAAL